MKRQRKLYVVTRKDLPWPERAVQAIHAGVNLAYTAGQKSKGLAPGGAGVLCADEWGPLGPHVILLGVEDRHVLSDFAAMPRAEAFREPDMGDELTAVALYQGALYDGRARLL